MGDLEVAVAVGVSHKLFFLVGTRRSLMPESKRWYDETGKLCMIRLFYMYTNMGGGGGFAILNATLMRSTVVFLGC